MPRREPETDVPTQTESTQRITQLEVIMEASYVNFTRAFESLLGRMPVDALSGLHPLSAQAAREKLGLRRVLVTCDEDNVGSMRVIEKNGGVLENIVSGPGPGKPKRRYWIEV